MQTKKLKLMHTFFVIFALNFSKTCHVYSVYHLETILKEERFRCTARASWSVHREHCSSEQGLRLPSLIKPCAAWGWPGMSYRGEALVWTVPGLGTFWRVCKWKVRLRNVRVPCFWWVRYWRQRPRSPLCPWSVLAWGVVGWVFAATEALSVTGHKCAVCAVLALRHSIPFPAVVHSFWEVTTGLPLLESLPLTKGEKWIPSTMVLGRKYLLSL